LNSNKHSILTQTKRYLDRSCVLERFGCAVVHLCAPAEADKVEHAIAKLSHEEDLVAVTVFNEDGHPDFLFVYPQAASRLAHPCVVANLNSPGSDPMTVVDEKEVARLAATLKPLGWRLVEHSEDWFMFDYAGPEIVS
jgi:hypothetical protein